MRRLFGSVALVLAFSAAFDATAFAQACGPAATAGGTDSVTCTSAGNPYTSGINYSPPDTNQVIVTLDSDVTIVNTTGTGVMAFGTNLTSIIANDASINVSGTPVGDAAGISAISNGGLATVTAGGAINVTGLDFSYGIIAEGRGGSSASVVYDGPGITFAGTPTGGDGSVVIAAFALGATGNASIDASGVFAASSPNPSFSNEAGLFSFAPEDASIIFRGGAVNMQGMNDFGLIAEGATTEITTRNGTSINVSYGLGAGAGIYAESTEAASAGGIVKIVSASNINITGAGGVGIEGVADVDAPISITSSGPGVTVSGDGGAGILATSGGGQIIIDSEAPIIATGDTTHGISASSATGDVQIIANDISATGANSDGILVAAGGATVQSNGTIVGALDGVHVNATSGTTRVTNTGSITGMTGAGIEAISSASTAATITNTGLVQGGLSGIDVMLTGGQPASIINDGTIQNLTGDSTAQAISGSGGPVSVQNGGLILGTVNFASSQTNSLQNDGTWDVAGGTSDFGGNSANLIQNDAGGVIIAADDPGAAQTTTFDGLGTFTNAGMLTMQDGFAGDRTLITGNYVGQGGTVAIDTYLGTDGSASDRLVLNGGTATGTSSLAVANTNGPGLKTNGNGIEVIEADAGATTTAGAFQLAGPVASGAYQYFLYRGGPNAAGAAGDGGDVAQNFYLRSDLIPPPPPPPPDQSPTPASSASAPTLPNYRPEVPVYLAMSEMASEMGFATIDNLQAREGDDFATPATAPSLQTTWCKNADLNYRCPLPNTKSPRDEQADLAQR